MWLTLWHLGVFLGFPSGLHVWSLGPLGLPLGLLSASRLFPLGFPLGILTASRLVREPLQLAALLALLPLNVGQNVAKVLDSCLYAALIRGLWRSGRSLGCCGAFLAADGHGHRDVALGLARLWPSLGDVEGHVPVTSHCGDLVVSDALAQVNVAVTLSCWALCGLPWAALHGPF